MKIIVKAEFVTLFFGVDALTINDSREKVRDAVRNALNRYRSVNDMVVSASFRAMGTKLTAKVVITYRENGIKRKLSLADETLRTEGKEPCSHDYRVELAKHLGALTRRAIEHIPAPEMLYVEEED